jgi:hypothetical protein
MVWGQFQQIVKLSVLVKIGLIQISNILQIWECSNDHLSVFMFRFFMLKTQGGEDVIKPNYPFQARLF